MSASAFGSAGAGPVYWKVLMSAAVTPIIAADMFAAVNATASGWLLFGLRREALRLRAFGVGTCSLASHQGWAPEANGPS